MLCGAISQTDPNSANEISPRTGEQLLCERTVPSCCWWMPSTRDGKKYPEIRTPPSAEPEHLVLRSRIRGHHLIRNQQRNQHSPSSERHSSCGLYQVNTKGRVTKNLIIKHHRRCWDHIKRSFANTGAEVPEWIPQTNPVRWSLKRMVAMNTNQPGMAK
ncbi:uncharacterized protein LOC129740984 [Uranotaenia lowii]|uniref:uncharacterized protein LOC129740984 n=1 Tax=Uranotaenia lowii TaxID=190385 RepID=UPI002479050C|nr:uncharacterized protein LOC129740984 [Uranotaenia lowii]